MSGPQTSPAWAGWIITSAVSAYREDRGRLLRFAIVGVGVAALYAGLFLGFRRWLDVEAALASIIAFAIAVTIQYVAQSLWTFRRPLSVPKQAGRFTTVVGVGAMVSTAITGWIGPALNAPDTVSVAFVVILLPIVNYLSFRLWVFRATEIQDPEHYPEHYTEEFTQEYTGDFTEDNGVPPR